MHAYGVYIPRPNARTEPRKDTTCDLSGGGKTSTRRFLPPRHLFILPSASCSGRRPPDSLLLLPLLSPSRDALQSSPLLCYTTNADL